MVTAKEQGKNSGKFYIYENGKWVDQITASNAEDAIKCYLNWKNNR